MRLVSLRRVAQRAEARQRLFWQLLLPVSIGVNSAGTGYQDLQTVARRL